MHSPRLLLLLSLLGVIVGHSAAAAVRVVECIDQNGNRGFYKSCPPNHQLISEHNLNVNNANTDSDNLNREPVVLYIIPQCDLCEDVIEFLQARDIPTTQKNVADDLPLQEELIALTGVLKVPVTVVGETIISGYDRGRLKTLLEAENYIKSNDESADTDNAPAN